VGRDGDDVWAGFRDDTAQKNILGVSRTPTSAMRRCASTRNRHECNDRCIDLSGWLSEQLGQASPDLLRQMITTFVQALMGAEADAVCGAEYGVHSEERTKPT